MLCLLLFGPLLKKFAHPWSNKSYVYYTVMSSYHLIKDLDGKTTRPKEFTGPLGRQLNNCEKLPVGEVDAITSPNIEINDTELSTD